MQFNSAALVAGQISLVAGGSVVKAHGETVVKSKVLIRIALKLGPVQDFG